ERRRHGRDADRLRQEDHLTEADHPRLRKAHRLLPALDRRDIEGIEMAAGDQVRRAPVAESEEVLLELFDVFPIAHAEPKIAISRDGAVEQHDRASVDRCDRLALTYDLPDRRQRCPVTL